MNEITGDLWRQHAAGRVVAITTGGLVSRSGRCAMPRGCAAEAKQRFPGLDLVLGRLVRQHGNHVHDLGQRIVSFPVEASPYELPSLSLIERSCRELAALADRNGWDRVVVPRPGCGGGGLLWPEVRGILARHFDTRFTIIDKEQA